MSDLRNREQELNSKTGMMLRDDFRKAVLGKTKQEVIQAIGKPEDTNDSGDYSFWRYDGQTKDPVTGKVDGFVSIFFVNGIADSIDFS